MKFLITKRNFDGKKIAINLTHVLEFIETDCHTVTVIMQDRVIIINEEFNKLLQDIEILIQG